MRKGLLMWALLLMATFLYSQTRDDVKVWVKPTTGAPTGSENEFFDETIRMELIGANYTQVDSQTECDYYIIPEIEHYIDEYDGLPHGSIFIKLYDNSDNHEMVQFSFIYDDLDSVYDFSLAMMYQAMANVPMTKLTGALQTDYWRNKWFYLSPYFMFSPHIYENANNWNRQLTLNEGAMFGGGLGVEVHFLNWLSIESGLELQFDEIQIDMIKKYPPSQTDNTYDDDNSFFQAAVLSIPLLVKFVWKPSNHFMIEPYAGISFNMSTNRSDINVPVITLLGGGQFAFAAGSIGGVFADLRFGYDLGNTLTPKEFNDAHRILIHLGIGYKFGFIDRIKNDERLLHK